MIRFVLCLTAALAMGAAAFGADISGSWTATFETQVGTQNYTYMFKVEGNKLTGTAKSNLGESTVDTGTVNGDDVSFVEHLTYQGMPLDIVYKGKISGNEIMFTRTIMGIAEQLVAVREHLGAAPRTESAEAQRQQSTTWRDPSPHRVQFVSVDRNVRLEVLDWGGSGRPVVLLAGGGDTAHVFDDFAPKLTANYHVYGITRRGYGASGFSPTESAADRLGDDVLAVLDSLKLKRAVLVGHSLAGEELSSVGTRYPDRIAGLVYLDAMYPYAFDNGKGPSMKEFMDLRGPQRPPPGVSDLASFSALQNYYLRVLGFTYPEGETRQQWNSTPDGRVGKSRGADFPGNATLMATLTTGIRKYTNIPVPALAILGSPHGQEAWIDNSTDSKVHEAAKAYSAALEALVARQVKAFEDGVPTARIVRLPGAHHYVFLSNEADVLREMNAFLRSLP
jgi:non-heme chloroperoxidase